jgi:formylglycine-generating enzyme required for sulfatase activity/uncharacterized caspase-like protein
VLKGFFEFRIGADSHDNHKIDQMMRRYIVVVFTAWLLLTAPMAAAQFAPQPAQRLALVVGNGAYEQNPIEHAPGDAQALGARLQALDFEVMLHQDLNLAGLHAALDQFTVRLADGAVGLFFFVGHGLQIDGDNYLVPTDAKAGFASEIAEQCLSLGAVLDQLAGSAAGQVVALIDAARPQPLKSRAIKTTRGLAAMAPPAGVTLMLADAPDTPHRFGPDPIETVNASPRGLFARILLDALSIPQLTLPQLLRQVKAGVDEATLGQRRPWISEPLPSVIVLNDPLERFGRLLSERPGVDALDFIANDPALALLPPKPEPPAMPMAKTDTTGGSAGTALETVPGSDQKDETATRFADQSDTDLHAFPLDYQLKLFERLVLDLERLALLEATRPSPDTHQAVRSYLRTTYADLCTTEGLCDPAAMVAAALAEAPVSPPEPPSGESAVEPDLSKNDGLMEKGQKESVPGIATIGDETEVFEPQPAPLSPSLDERQRAELLRDFEVMLLDAERQRMLTRSNLSPSIKAAGKAALDQRYPPAFEPERRMIELVNQVDPENREALVIGNGVQGPEAAADLCNALEGQGFYIEQHQTIGSDRLRRAIEDFSAQLHGTRVGFFYFGGDAFEYQGQNYLVPADVNADNESSLVNQAVPLALLLSGLEAAQNVFNVVVIDAPSKPVLPQGVSLPEVGLAEVTPPANTLVLLPHTPNVARVEADKAKWAPGSVVASDGEVSGDVAGVKALMMADKLAPLLYTPRLELGALLGQLEIRLLAATQPPQQAWWRGSMRPFIFNDPLRRFDTLLTRLDFWRHAKTVDPTGRWSKVLWNRLVEYHRPWSTALESEDMRGLIMAALNTDQTLELDQLAWERGYTPTYTNKQGMRFTYVPKGEFVMGSRADESKREKDEKAFNAFLTEGFYMMPAEVTQGEWQRVMARNPAVFDDCGPDCPVEMVSWNEAQQLIDALNGVVLTEKPSENGSGAPAGGPALPISIGEATEKSRSTESALDQGKDEVAPDTETKQAATEAVKAILEARTLTPAELAPIEQEERSMYYQFPTEAQWEYTCRAGEHELFGFGHDLWSLPSYAWYKENAKSSTHPVAVLKPNRWGFYDMHGNVWEWCQDNKWDYPLNDATNPAGRGLDRLKVVRGGSWYYGAMDARCANRYYYLPAQANYNIGLRLVARPR